MWDAPLSLWQQSLQRYDIAVAQKHTDLPALERFVFSTLPSEAASRDKSHVTKEEYVKLVSWKLKRGKVRPRLMAYAYDLSESDVVTASASAISEMAKDDPLLALKPLLSLRGCGPATASAVLGALSQQHPFMSDELLSVALGSMKYTVSVRGSFHVNISLNNPICAK